MEIGEYTMFLRNDFVRMFQSVRRRSSKNDIDVSLFAARSYLLCVASVLGLSDHMDARIGEAGVLSQLNTPEAQQEMIYKISNRSERLRVSEFPPWRKHWVSKRTETVSAVLKREGDVFFRQRHWQAKDLRSLLGQSPYYYCLLSVLHLGVYGARELARTMRYSTEVDVDSVDNGFIVKRSNFASETRDWFETSRGMVDDEDDDEDEDEDEDEKDENDNENKHQHGAASSVSVALPPKSPIVPPAAPGPADPRWSGRFGRSSFGKNMIMARFREMQCGKKARRKRDRVPMDGASGDERASKASSAQSASPKRRPNTLVKKKKNKTGPSLTVLGNVLQEFIGPELFGYVCRSRKFLAPTQADDDQELVRWLTIDELIFVQRHHRKDLTSEGRALLENRIHERKDNMMFTVSSRGDGQVQVNGQDLQDYVCNSCSCHQEFYDTATKEVRAAWEHWNTLRQRVGLPLAIPPTPVYCKATRDLICPGCGIILVNCASENNPMDSFRGYGEDSSKGERMGATVVHHDSVSTFRLNASVEGIRGPSGMERIARRVNRSNRAAARKQRRDCAVSKESQASIHLFETYLHTAFQMGMDDFQHRYAHVIPLQRIRELWEFRLAGKHWLLAQVCNKTTSRSKYALQGNLDDVHQLPCKIPTIEVDMSQRQLAAVGNALVRGLALLVELEQNFQLRIRAAERVTGPDKTWMWFEVQPPDAKARRGSLPPPPPPSPSSRARGQSDEDDVTSESTGMPDFVSPIATARGSPTTITPMSMLGSASGRYNGLAKMFGPLSRKSRGEQTTTTRSMALYHKLERMLCEVLGVDVIDEHLDQHLEPMIPSLSLTRAHDTASTPVQELLGQWTRVHFSNLAQTIWERLMLGHDEKSCMKSTFETMTDRMQQTLFNPAKNEHAHSLRAYAREALGPGCDAATVFHGTNTKRLCQRLYCESRRRSMAAQNLQTAFTAQSQSRPRSRPQRRVRVARRFGSFVNWLGWYVFRWTSGRQVWMGFRQQFQPLFASANAAPLHRSMLVTSAGRDVVLKLEEKVTSCAQQCLMNLYLLHATLHQEVPRLYAQDERSAQVLKTLMIQLREIGYQRSARSVPPQNGDKSMREMVHDHRALGARTLLGVLRHGTDVIDMGQILYRWWALFTSQLSRFEHLQNKLCQAMIQSDVHWVLSFMRSSVFLPLGPIDIPGVKSLRDIMLNFDTMFRRQLSIDFPIEMHLACSEPSQWTPMAHAVPCPWGMRPEHLCLMLRVTPSCFPPPLLARMRVYVVERQGDMVRALPYEYKNVFDRLYGPESFDRSLVDITAPEYAEIPRSWYTLLETELFPAGLPDECLDAEMLPVLRESSHDRAAIVRAVYWSLRLDQSRLFESHVMPSMQTRLQRELGASADMLLRALENCGARMWSTLTTHTPGTAVSLGTLEHFWISFLVATGQMESAKTALEYIPRLSRVINAEGRTIWDLYTTIYQSMTMDARSTQEQEQEQV